MFEILSNEKGGMIYMSVIIKNMNFPDICENCRMCVIQWTQDDDPMSFAYCNAAEEFIAKASDGSDKIVSTAILSKVDWCPLVDIPKPHGRLIDADALADDLDADAKKSFNEYYGVEPEDDEDKKRLSIIRDDCNMKSNAASWLRSECNKVFLDKEE